MDNEIVAFIEKNKEQMLESLEELCHIPAPSHMEQKRAEYCKNWLEREGAEGVYIDSALNVIFPINCGNSKEITVFAAHTDTVFPDLETMPYYDDGEKIHCPGASDDTASVAVLLEMAKFFIQKNLKPAKGILLVCNSCEEGLGNLKGCRQLFEDYAGRIRQFITFDSSLHMIADRCVGSHRYEVEVKTKGGHSYVDFGNKNAIAELAKIAAAIYEIEIPPKEGANTTYNVGLISGGTSVNTIAQSAKMLCEYRSDDLECLHIMQKHFESIFANAACEGVQVNVTKVGDRPCSATEPEKIEEMKRIAVPIIEGVIGKAVSYSSASTDCNIPLSLAVPAICVGVNIHAGVHTREEWVDKQSLIPGLEIAIGLGKAFGEV